MSRAARHPCRPRGRPASSRCDGHPPRRGVCRTRAFRRAPLARLPARLSARVTGASSPRRRHVIAPSHPVARRRRPAGTKTRWRTSMKRLLVAATVGLLTLMTVAGPVGARDFGAVYANDAVYRVFGNAAHVPDGTGTDPFATFTNSTNDDQLGVAAFAPGSPTGHHGGRWAVYRVTWTLRRLVDARDELVPAGVARRRGPADHHPRRGRGLPLPGPRERRTARARRPTAGRTARLPDHTGAAHRRHRGRRVEDGAPVGFRRRTTSGQGQSPPSSWRWRASASLPGTSRAPHPLRKRASRSSSAARSRRRRASRASAREWSAAARARSAAVVAAAANCSASAATSSAPAALRPAWPAR